MIDRTGGIYFTDPRYKAPEPWPQVVEAFYYRSADGLVNRLGSDLVAPNGIVLSPDEKTLYVVPSLQKEVVAFDVELPGVLENRRVFCELRQKDQTGNKGGDGCAVDIEGNLYVTTDIGIQVYSPQKQSIGNTLSNYWGSLNCLRFQPTAALPVPMARHFTLLVGQVSTRSVCRMLDTCFP